MSRPVVLLDLGLTEYEAARQFQLATLQKIREGDPSDYLLLVEHPEVYTFGRKSTDKFEADNAVEVERGGEATYHNPGQLVAYPIFKLEEGERDIHAFLRRLEESLIRTLARLNIPAVRVDGATGVWTTESKRKIASIGVAVKHWITYHGIALNVANDLSGFSKINPCGFSADVMTSLQREGRKNQLDEVKKIFVEELGQTFGRSIAEKT